MCISYLVDCIERPFLTTINLFFHIRQRTLYKEQHKTEINCRNSSLQCGHWRLLLSHTFACTLEIRKRLWTSKYVGRLGVGIRGHDDPINELCSPHWADMFSGAAFIISCFFRITYLNQEKKISCDNSSCMKNENACTTECRKSLTPLRLHMYPHPQRISWLALHRA